ncbi:MAG: TadE/TadG family type IV pilus assembly protein [Xanthobacteraceae bacterium]
MFAAILNKFVRTATSFRCNTRGNVAVITALATLPLVAAVGCVVDYTTASMIKTKLQAAADAASLATVSISSSVITTAKNMTGNGAVSGGSTYATNFFNSNLSTSPENTGYSSVTPTATVTKNGMILTATVSFTAQVPTTFMGIAGYKNVTVSGTSTASYTLSTYIDFYMALDVSGSMGMPSTSSEQSRLMAVNPDNFGNYPSGCTFACHFGAQGACGQSNQGQTSPANTVNNPPPGQKMSGSYIPNPNPGGYCQGYTISRLGTTTKTISGKSYTVVNWGANPGVSACSTAGTSSCIQLRLDAVGYAVSQLLTTAANTEAATGISNQYRVGLYPFIEDSYAYFPLTTNLTSTGSGSLSAAASQLATLLDTGKNSSLGSGGTHIDTSLGDINALITSVGTGSSSTNTLPYVFIVTDGSEDPQSYWNGNWSGSNHATTLNTSICTTMKNRGITVAVLYIPYVAVSPVNSSFANDEDDYANWNIPNIPASLQSCASPNFYYTASTPADINNALNEMFEQAISTAHITN